MVAVALQTGLLTWNGLVTAANRLLSRFSTRHGEAKACRQKMRTAKDYEVQQNRKSGVTHGPLYNTCLLLLPSPVLPPTPPPCVEDISLEFTKNV